MKCSFCGADIPLGTGKIVILPDGSHLVFCSNKCEKNYLNLKRSPQKVRWTAKYHEEKQIKLFGKEKKAKKVKEEEKPKKKRLSKKERRELRKKKKLEKKMKKKEKAKKKEEKPNNDGGEAQ